MALIGFMKLPDIDGASTDEDHQGEIEIHGLKWGAEQNASRFVRSGRTKSRAEVDALRVQKTFDQASPYIALATMNGKVFDEVEISLRKDSGDTHPDYLVITLSDVILRAYDMHHDEAQTMDQLVREEVELSFEKIKMLYVTQADDHSAGDEHEIEFDLRQSSPITESILRRLRRLRPLGPVT